MSVREASRTLSSDRVLPQAIDSCSASHRAQRDGGLEAADAAVALLTRPLVSPPLSTRETMRACACALWELSA